MTDTCKQQGCCQGAPSIQAPPKAKAPLLDEAVPCCEYYPVSIDVDRRLLSFTRISRNTYRNSAFLVPRWTDMGGRLYTFNLDDLLLRRMTSPLQCARTHYILISAFCCSTLLARYLDEVPRCLVLKEPAMVAQLGLLRYRKGRLSRDGWPAEWQQLAALGLGLMSRAFSPDETVVIKPSDIGNCVGDVVLDNDPRSKVLLLSIKLRTFILSVLKSDSRCDWTRKRVRFWRPIMDAFPAFKSIDVKALDDAKMSAYLWLTTNVFWKDIRSKAAPDRVLVLDGEQVSHSPVSALTRVLAFFGLPCEPDDVTRIANSETASQHSKKPRTRYDAAAREADLVAWEERFGKQADRAIEWAINIAEQLRLGRVDGPVAGVAPEEVENTSSLVAEIA
jgi:hypothetical protein